MTLCLNHVANLFCFLFCFFFPPVFSVFVQRRPCKNEFCFVLRPKVDTTVRRGLQKTTAKTTTAKSTAGAKTTKTAPAKGTKTTTAKGTKTSGGKNAKARVRKVSSMEGTNHEQRTKQQRNLMHPKKA